MGKMYPLNEPTQGHSITQNKGNAPRPLEGRGALPFGGTAADHPITGGNSTQRS